MRKNINSIWKWKQVCDKGEEKLPQKRNDSSEHLEANFVFMVFT